MFETTGILNEDVLKILKKYSISPNAKRFFKIFAITSAIFSIICIPISLKGSIFFAFMVLVFILEYFLAINIFYKKSLSIMKESTEANEYCYKVVFDEIGAIVSNLTIGATVQLKYDAFVRIEEIHNMYFLFTKSNQYIIVFKDCLDTKQVNDFKSFNKERCKNIK